MQTGKYKAVVFDLDGTAVNSHYNIDALQMTCIELLDREATDEELKITYGMTAVNAMRYLGVPEDQLETFGNRWLEHIMRLAKHATLFDGIYPTCAGCTRRAFSWESTPPAATTSLATCTTTSASRFWSCVRSSSPATR